MGIGPVPAINAVVESADLSLREIHRFEVNEALARRSWPASANSASTKTG
jgi:acetyl-CoA acetyltransferase